MKWRKWHYHRPTMRDRCLLVVAAVAVAVAAGSADVVQRSFDQDAVGSAPPGFTFAAARLPAAGRWLVRGDAGGRDAGSNRYVVHLADEGPTTGFALALLDAPPPADLRLSARVKTVDGARIGGLVWRYQSPENFYAVELDLNAQEVALYHVTRGNRIRLEFEDDIELDRDAWHVLRVEHAGGRIRVALGGIGIMRARARDDGKADGRAGFWSAGNSTTWFDDLDVQQAQPERER
jgi:hypothetical protein